jgi:hypothetical protein
MYPQHFKIKPVRATCKNYLKSSAVKSVGWTSTSQLPVLARITGSPTRRPTATHSSTRPALGVASFGTYSFVRVRYGRM